MSASESRYIVAGNRPWNRALFERALKPLPGRWDFAATVEELGTLLATAPAPRYVFFLHWSHRVPDTWLAHHECVCFHMTDVPYGRGGSPLQNLILRGHRDTKLTALRMIAEMDAGPVYLKEPLNLEGSAEEIYVRAGELSIRMIAVLVRDQVAPVPQAGTPVIFKRRQPAQSALPTDLPGLGALHDFIRMLDAEGYPHAYLDLGGFRFHFRHSCLDGEKLTAEVTVTSLPSSLP